MSATVPVQRTRETASPLSWQSAEAWIQGLNDFVEARAKGFEYCRVGVHGRKHRIELVSHADGRITIEPACRVGYYGESVERVQPVSAHADGEFCTRLSCVYDTPGRRAPQYAPTLNPRQMELELTV
jgi:hypothetical protein